MRVRLGNLGYLLRRLRRSPTFTIVVIFTLALGIGATTAIFSVVNGVLLEALPFERSDRLVFLERPGQVEGDLSLPDGEDLRAGSETLQELALYMPSWAYDLTGDGEPLRVSGTLIEPAYTRVLRVRPLLGRGLTDADNVAGGERVTVIGAGFWRRRFGADPEVIGRRITLSGNPYTIVGVMPAELDLFELGTDVWMPIGVEAPWLVGSRGTNNLEAIGRLAGGASLEAARTEIRTLSERLAERYPDTNQGKVVRPIPLQDVIVGNVRTGLLVLFGGVALVLLIACVNLANLLLVRSKGRERELAVRLALGGSRFRIARLVVGESVLLALVGGAAGVLVAWWGTDLLLGLAPSNLPRLDRIGVDLAVLGFSGLLSAATGFAFGLAPAWYATRRDPAELLARGGGRADSARGGGRLLAGFVVSQVALAFLLLIGSGLLLRSFLNLRAVDPGFETEGITTANLVLPESRYAEVERQTRAFEAMVEALGGQPGVERAAFIIGAPLAAYGEIGHSLRFDDRPPPEPGDTPSARVRPVLGDYFGAMGVPILRGRAFTPDEDEDSPPVAIVNESFADLHWPDQDPVGERLAFLGTGSDAPVWRTVVGVAADVQQANLTDGDAQTVYIPYLQREMAWARFGTLIARGRGGTAGLARALEAAVWEVDPAVPLETIVPMSRRVADAMGRERFLSTLLATFAAVALVIAMQGVYGVLSYMVSQRRAELGVRIALGARAADVLRLVLRRGLLLTAAGLAVGAAASLALARLIDSLLHGVTPADGLTFAAVSLVLGGAALVACWLPARRAVRVDPLQALKHE